jgi:hypothetical protein
MYSRTNDGVKRSKFPRYLIRNTQAKYIIAGMVLAE